MLLRKDLASLPDEVTELVRAQLGAGHFQSVDEVVCEALRLLHEREELFASQREVLRRGWGVSVPSYGRPRTASGRPALAYIAYRSDVRPIRIARIARASRDWSRFAPG